MDVMGSAAVEGVDLMANMGEEISAELREELHRTEVQLSHWVAEREQRLGDMQARAPCSNCGNRLGYCCSDWLWHGRCLLAGPSVAGADFGGLRALTGAPSAATRVMG